MFFYARSHCRTSCGRTAASVSSASPPAPSLCPPVCLKARSGSQRQCYNEFRSRDCPCIHATSHLVTGAMRGMRSRKRVALRPLSPKQSLTCSLSVRLSISTVPFSPTCRQACRHCKRPREEHPPSLEPIMALQQQQQRHLVAAPNASPMNASIDSKSTMESGTGGNGDTEAQKSNSDNPAAVNPKQAHSDDDSGCALEEYTWVPPGLKPDQVRTSEQSGVCGDYKSKFDGISMWPSFCCFPCSEN